MPLTPEQVQELKEQLSEQIQHLPEEQRRQAQIQIDEMSPEALEILLKQQQSKDPQQQKGIFRMIIDGDVPSKKLHENTEAVAVVSIRAVSKGHVLIIPKKPVGDANSMPSGAYNLARQIGKKISSKLKVKSTAIQTENAFGEVVINVIPIYDGPLSMNSPRYEVKEGELEEVYKLLRTVKKTKTTKIKIEKKEENLEKILKLKRRIP